MRVARAILLVMFLSLVSLPAQAQKRDSVLERLRSDNAEERVAALRLLAKMPAHLPALEPLTEALSDPSPDVRQQALKTWGLAGESYNKVVSREHRARPLFTEEQKKAKRQAYSDWQKEVVEAIGACANDNVPKVRLETAYTLARLGDSIRYIFPPYLSRCPSGGYSPLDYLADEHLRRMAKQRPAILHTLVQEKEAQVVYRAATSLAAADDQKIFPILQAFMRHPDPVWRMIGCVATSYQGTDEDILPLLADRDDRVRQCAVHNLFKKHEVLEKLAASFPQMNALQKRSFLLLHEWTPPETPYSDFIRAACYDRDADLLAVALKMTAYAPVKLPDAYVKSLLRACQRSLCSEASQ
jgi:hypothetical protein